MSQTASDPADELQEGLYELLTADATLTTTLGAEVYDGAPEDQEPPYVTVGEMLSTDDSVHGDNGRATEATLHTWTRAESHRPGNVIGARLVALLHRQHAALDAVVEGHKVYRVSHEFAQTLDDPEPGIRHRVDRFRIWTRQEGP